MPLGIGPALSTVTQLIRDIGLLGTAIFVIYASYRRWWVWGSEIDALRKDRDEWKSIALRLSGITDRMINGSRT